MAEVTEPHEMTCDQRAELQKKIILNKMHTVRLHDDDLKLILLALESGNTLKI